MPVQMDVQAARFASRLLAIGKSFVLPARIQRFRVYSNENRSAESIHIPTKLEDAHGTSQ
jgi:hypothetical protein